MNRRAHIARHPTHSRQEWVTRYVSWLVEATADCLSVDEACLLAQHEYEIGYDMSPEAAAGRLLVWRDDAAEVAAAGYSAAILIAKVGARGFRPVR